MALTREQIIANINALEEQGADEVEVKEYLASLSAPAQEKQPASGVKGFGVGVLKGIGRTALNIVKDREQIMSAIPAVNVFEIAKNTKIGKKIFSPIINVEDMAGQAVENLSSALEYENTAQKAGGYTETAAEFLLPSALATKGALAATKGSRVLSAAKKALTMDSKELQALPGKMFKKIFNLDKAELPKVGGWIKDEVKGMPAKINQLADEFKEVLQGSSSENITKIKELKSSLWKQTLGLFEGSNKSLNEKQIRSAISRAIKEKIAFLSLFNKKDVLEKTIEPFMKQVKSGTLKGLEEARGKFSIEARDATGQLKQAKQVLHDAVKAYIREQLPESKRVIYDNLKKTHAKAFEVLEILKAKNKYTSGTSLLKKSVKVIGGGGAAVWLANEARKLFK